MDELEKRFMEGDLDLNSLLIALKNAADQSDSGAVLRAQPVLNAASYFHSNFHLNTELTGLTYVGCLGQWLEAKRAMTGVRVSERKAAVGQTELASMTPANYAKIVMDGKLFGADIAAPFQTFVAAYSLHGYGSDYWDTNVTAKLKRNMSEVDDSEITYIETSTEIERRYRAFLDGASDWNKLKSHYEQLELGEFEKTVAGWVDAFVETLQRDTLPEKFRREAVNRFYALVDYVPAFCSANSGIASEQEQQWLVATILTAFSATSDSGVMQSASNALREMDFAHVLAAILDDAERLQANEWLEQLLALWTHMDAGQIAEFKRQIDACGSAARAALAAALETGIEEESEWAKHYVSFYGGNLT